LKLKLLTRRGHLLAEQLGVEYPLLIFRILVHARILFWICSTSNGLKYTFDLKDTVATASRRTDANHAFIVPITSC
jgi:hypothetical protein